MKRSCKHGIIHIYSMRRIVWFVFYAEKLYCQPVQSLKIHLLAYVLCAVPYTFSLNLCRYIHLYISVHFKDVA